MCFMWYPVSSVMVQRCTGGFRHPIWKGVKKKRRCTIWSHFSSNWMACRPAVVTRVGHPSVEIVQYAKDRNVDLIVMGTDRRGLLAHLRVGGVVEKVARKAPCPVLTVQLPRARVRPALT